MRTLLVVAAVFCVPACSYAQGEQAKPTAPAAPVAKACEELKSEIAAKLDAKGVKGYTLEIVEKDKEVAEGKAVGTCEGGTKKIVYHREAATPQTPAKESTKP
ncbi:MAG TPA: DUF1161 domain-containing protein [Candidatus Acidoferrum sp.]